ncbi:hypothetical protein ETB97_012660 [Aspergillus alliaceus]|uniref:Uncharacterized protein n=1 Tax=Petromyces alliaceus TaxID=209559 RepID=A0A8H6A7P4_PETAA|nr:hypothetical protein ETB97_012660 [Aspergillus burnettii]
MKIAVENFCVKLRIDTSSRLEIVAGSVSGSSDCRRCPAALPAWFDVRVDDEFPVLVGTAKDISRRRCRNGRGEGNTWEEENKKSDEKSNRPVVVLLWERYREWYDVEATRSNSKSSLGQFIRFVRRIPPYIWVINQTDEEITVVVKKYAPTRRVVGTQVNVSLIGGGISLDFESSKIKDTEKKLAPQARDPVKSLAIFPLWTRADGFGIISIFKGTDRNPVIQNGRVRISARVYFRGGPNLVSGD